MKMYWDDPRFKQGLEMSVQGTPIRPKGTKPNIIAYYIDGPVLFFRDGKMHRLNTWERLLLYFGWTDADKLETKLRPHLAWLLERRRGDDSIC
jgi:hypothetical protein